MTKEFSIVKTTKLNEQTSEYLLDLWNNEYPENLTYSNLNDFLEYLNKLSNTTHFLLTNDQNHILGWAFTFDRENEKWFVIIIAEKIKGKGYGRQILDSLKQNEPVLNGWVIDHNNYKKINGQTYFSPLKFYEKSDFEILKTQRLELEKISAVKLKWIKN
jgi:hypothetical protein